ncbi:MAG: hypothetical protein LAO78_25340 [Acidobacteriia bacterium]|nr:hypothetical protein [Terriglobia bacterium]
MPSFSRPWRDWAFSLSFSFPALTHSAGKADRVPGVPGYFHLAPNGAKMRVEAEARY